MPHVTPWPYNEVQLFRDLAMASKPAKEIGAAMVAATAVPTALNWTDVIKTRMQGVVLAADRGGSGRVPSHHSNTRN